ncbi:MAG TPA: glycosyltransferase family 39 protein [Bryobacteraceae bacterium]|nr:glycosyltransferase family 39 protein [Bryobacteraceae bacterium]
MSGSSIYDRSHVSAGARLPGGAGGTDRGWPLVLLLAVCIARLWLAPVTSSYWVDELVTVFVVKHPGSASFAVAPQVPESIYYWLPRMTSAIFGESEAAYRLSSLLAMAAALWFIARIAARWIHPRAGWFAVFTALSIRGIDYFAVDARPYALGILAAASCIWFLMRWLDSANWVDAGFFALCAAAMWWVQLMFWPFYLVVALYFLVRVVNRETPVPPAQWITVAVALLAALIPRALAALALARQATAHSFAAMPTLHIFEHELHWNIPVLCAAALWVLTRFAKPHPRAPRSLWILLLAWWLCQPVVLFLYSHAAGNSVYVGRYFSTMLPAVALVATLAVAYWMPENRWNLAAACMGVVALIAQGHTQSLSYRHDISDWRSADEEINRFAPNASVPVIVVSPFIEGRAPAWTPDYALPGFLYAHLEGYPVKGRLILFPYTGPDDPEARKYAEALLASHQLPGKWAIYGQIPGHDWDKWFAARPELAGWHHVLKKFGDVIVVEFTAGTSSTP